MVTKERLSFASKFGVVAAAAGSAVGLGNIWKFPYEAGQNGGGAFLIIYIICVLLLGLPIMLSEFVIGRKGHSNAVGAFRAISGRNGWSWVGIMGVLTAFMILAFYFVVSGWSLEYVYQAVVDAFHHQSIEDLNVVFTEFTLHTYRPLIWILLFILLSGGIILGGVEKGIERSAKVLMPLLVLILIYLAIRSVMMPNSRAGLDFYFRLDFSKITPSVLLNALGQAFFSLSLGMGCMITYGSYIKAGTSLPKIAMQTAGVDTCIAILSGLMIFPAVFSLGIDPSQGPKLVFITLPAVFNQMVGGYVIAILFFVLLSVAALTSTISLMEVITAYLVEEHKWKRSTSVICIMFILMLLSALCSISLQDNSPLKLFHLNLFDLFDFITSKFFMPIGGLSVALFVGWFMKRKDVSMELIGEAKHKVWFAVFMFLVRYFVPAAIVLIFFNELGFFTLFGKL